MAFIVENGTGVKGANSYATVQFFKDYFGDRPEDVSAISDVTIQTLLVAATDYIDQRWGLRFLGRREFKSELTSRSILTLTDNPSDGETVTFDVNTYTFRTTPSATNDVEIGTRPAVSLANLASKIAEIDTDVFEGSRFFDPDVDSVALYASRDGIVTTETLANGSFDTATTAGFSGKRQPLEFPRVLLTDRAGEDVTNIPELLKNATCEYAFRANTAPLDPDPVVHATGRVQTKDRTKVGPIETEVEFSNNNSFVQITKPFPAADRMLREYVTGGGVIRA